MTIKRSRAVAATVMLGCALLAWPSTGVAAPPGAALSVAARSFDNPVIAGFHPDPSICRVGDDFYLVTSSFEYFPGVPIFHSRDLVHWRQLGHVLTSQSQLDLAGVPSSGGIYAPTLRCANGVFTVITTHVNGGGNFYVTARDPGGPWSAPVWLDKEGFDPSLLLDGDKAYYLRDGKGKDFSHPRVHQTTMDLRTGKLLEPFRVIWAGTGGVWTEGAHVYRLRDRYYLLAAEGGTEYGHAEMVARGPSPFGPFQGFAGNPILSHRQRPSHPIQATGHADLVELQDGSTWAVFLATRPAPGGDGRHHHLGRETFLAPVTWTEDGWPVIGNGGAVELRMERPALAPHPFPPRPARDAFDSATLAPDWNFVRNPDPADTSLSQRPGFLRVWGSPVTLDQVASPALVARRQQAFDVVCRAALDFSPRQPNEDAGLTVRANERFHYDLVIRAGTGAAREALLLRRIAGITTVAGHAALGPGPVELSVSATAGAYTFDVRTTGQPIVLGTLPTAALSAEDIARQGGNYFTGVYVGAFATGNGRRSTAPADFDWFECSERGDPSR